MFLTQALINRSSHFETLQFAYAPLFILDPWVYTKDTMYMYLQQAAWNQSNYKRRHTFRLSPWSVLYKMVWFFTPKHHFHPTTQQSHHKANQNQLYFINSHHGHTFVQIVNPIKYLGHVPCDLAKFNPQAKFSLDNKLIGHIGSSYLRIKDNLGSKWKYFLPFFNKLGKPVTFSSRC